MDEFSNKITNDAPPKARLVILGNHSSEKEVKVSSESPTASRDSITFLLSMATQFKWSIGTLDVSAAYLQGDPIERYVYVTPLTNSVPRGTFGN